MGFVGDRRPAQQTKDVKRSPVAGGGALCTHVAITRCTFDTNKLLAKVIWRGGCLDGGMTSSREQRTDVELIVYDDSNAFVQILGREMDRRTASMVRYREVLV